jgi:transposase
LREWFDSQYETVSSWLDKWETEGLAGIFDSPRSDRPERLTATETAAFLGYIDENPHQTKAAAARLLAKTGKEASLDTFKQVLKKALTSGNVADNP